MKNRYRYSVFINCPFDDDYIPLFDSLIFTIQDCGFIPRCSLELIDGSQKRIDKISDIIQRCKYGIHDISRTELDKNNNLPRFNMPLELGIFLGAKIFGSTLQNNKNCVILDKDKFRYQKFISDISGQDISSHKNEPKNLVKSVRDWLNGLNHNTSIIPSGSIIFNRFLEYEKDLPLLCTNLHLDHMELNFNDKCTLMIEWLKMNKLV